MKQRVASMLIVLAVLLVSLPARAFWVLNFSTGQTMAPGKVGFIGGTGGQLTLVGEPQKTSYTPFLAHAGLRVGLTDWLDIGYRLVTVPMPYNTVGPSLGAASDLKLRLTPKDSPWRVAVIAGGAFSFLELTSQSRLAWSPGAAVVVSHPLTQAIELAVNARYLYAVIPSAEGGASANHVHGFGGSVAAKIALTPRVSVIPEIGLFRFLGALSGTSTNGWGMQYGAVLATAI